MRKKIYEMISIAKEDDTLSKIYDLFMISVICISIVPLAFKSQTTLLQWLDKITVSIFIMDYILRIFTADYSLNKGKILSFILYPFTPMATVDLLSILPSIIEINKGFRLFKIFRLFRSFRVFRVFKMIRYSKSINMIINIFHRQKDALLTVCGIAGTYIVISALIIINVEPDSFNNFFEAIYWATVSLTTVGYGDIYPVSTAGKLVTMFSSIFGIAIIALPASIITAGMMDEINKEFVDES